MANSAINQSAGIFLEGGRQFQAANSRIMDALNAAADMAMRQRMAREAQLAAEREKQMERDAKAAEAAMQPEAILAQAIQKGPESLTPQQRAAFEANQKLAGAKVAIQPMTGQVYNPYQPVSLDGLEAPNAASPGAAFMGMPAQPLPAPSQSPVADMLLPPTASGQQGDMSIFASQGQAPMANVLPPPEEEKAPAPLGTKEVKYSPQSSNPLTQTPAGQMKRLEKELDFYGQKLLKDYEKGLDAEATAKSQGLVDQALQRLNELNDKLNEKGAIVSAERGVLKNAKAMARGAEIPVPFGESVKIGAFGEKALDPETRKLRDEYEKLRATLFPFYAKASGLAATAIDTEQARKEIMNAMGDPNGIYESNKQQLRTLSTMIGSGKLSEKQSGDIDVNDPRVRKALQSGYTKEQIRDFLNGRK